MPLKKSKIRAVRLISCISHFFAAVIEGGEEVYVLRKGVQWVIDDNVRFLGVKVIERVDTSDGSTTYNRCRIIGTTPQVISTLVKLGYCIPDEDMEDDLIIKYLKGKRLTLELHRFHFYPHSLAPKD